MSRSFSVSAMELTGADGADGANLLTMTRAWNVLTPKPTKSSTVMEDIVAWFVW